MPDPLALPGFEPAPAPAPEPEPAPAPEALALFEHAEPDADACHACGRRLTNPASRARGLCLPCRSRGIEALRLA